MECGSEVLGMDFSGIVPNRRGCKEWRISLSGKNISDGSAWICQKKGIYAGQPDGS